MIQGKPSPRVGRRFPLPPAVATLGSVEDVEDVDEVDVGGGGVTVWLTDAEVVATSIATVNTANATARRTGATVVDMGVG